MNSNKQAICRLILIGLAGISAFFCPEARAQVDTEFWFAVPEVTNYPTYNPSEKYDRPIRLVFTTRNQPANVEISIPAAGLSVRNFSMEAASDAMVDLTDFIDQLENKPPQSVLNNGLLIRSDAPVTVYYEILNNRNGAPIRKNCDLFILKGRNGLGTEFVVSGQTEYQNDRQPIAWEPPARSSLNIVATEDNTQIAVTPVGGETVNFALNRGQTYAWEPPDRTVNDQQRLVGARVVSDKPVAVTLEQDILYVGTSLDVAGDQLLPIDRLGTEYIFVENEALSTVDRIYLTATGEGAVLTTSAASLSSTELAPYETAVLDLKGEGAVHLTADAPVCAYHLTSIGGGSGNEVGGAVVPPLECTGSSRVGINRSPPGMSYYANLIVPSNSHFGKTSY